jgi:DNA-binding transcriptional ArsR family regulator
LSHIELLVDVTSTAATARWELYRLLGEPFRLRLLTLAGTEELSVGELAELLGESQPNVSKHVSTLRRAGLLAMRKQGTRVFVRVPEALDDDAVIADALAAGRALCESDGSLGRVAEVVRARDRAARELFARGAATKEAGELELDALPPELPAYLAALAPLVPERALAVDAGTGDGRLLDVLAPIFDRVIAIDRSDARLARAAERIARRSYANVELLAGEVGDALVRDRVGALGGADVVLASRILHHAPRPRDLLVALGSIAKPGGAIVVIDYQAHDDERLRESQADLWLGFEGDELAAMARDAGLVRGVVTALPRALIASGARGVAPDSHLGWHVLIARRPAAADDTQT